MWLPGTNVCVSEMIYEDIFGHGDVRYVLCEIEKNDVECI